MRATIIAQQKQQQGVTDKERNEEPPALHIPPILHSNCKNVPFAAIKPNDTKSTRTTTTTTTTTRRTTLSKRRRSKRATTINAIATTPKDTRHNHSNRNRWNAIVNSSCCCLCEHKKYYETHQTRAKAMRLKENLIRSSSRNGRTNRRNLNMLTTSLAQLPNTNKNTNTCCCHRNYTLNRMMPSQAEEHQNYVNLLPLSYDGQQSSINNEHQLQYQQHNDVIDLINYDDDYRIMANETKKCRHHGDDEQVGVHDEPLAARDIDCYYDSNEMTNSCLVVNSRRCVVATAVAAVAAQSRRRNNKLRYPQLVMPIEDMQSVGEVGKVSTTTTTTTTNSSSSSCCGGSRLENVVQLPTAHKAYGNAKDHLCEAALNDDDKVADVADEPAPPATTTTDYDYYYKEISQTTTLVCSNSSSCNTGSHSIRCIHSGSGSSRRFKENSDMNRTTFDQDVDVDKQQYKQQQQQQPTPVVESDEPKGQCTAVVDDVDVRVDKGVPLERVMRTCNTIAAVADVANVDGDGSCQSGGSNSCRSVKHHNKEMELPSGDSFRPQGGAASRRRRSCRLRLRLRRELHDLLPVLGKMQFANSCTSWGWWTSSSSALRLLFTILAVFTLTTSVDCWAGRQDALSNCTFPARWEGSWFLSGYQQSIHIKGSQFSYRGRCAASDGNKYLIVDEKGCHRCLVIYEKHKNVLQYKESECEGDSLYLHQTNPSAMAMHSVVGSKQQTNSDHRGGAHPNTNSNMNMNMNTNNGHSRLSSSDQYIMRSNDDMNDYFCKGRETLQNLCDQIPGDALLYSLFRESAEPVKCPLRGPFVFTYNRGHGECKNPVSNIESCTEESRLLLSFQACHDVQGTESTVEELTCLATWKDGNSRYLVGLVSHHHAISNEERYRCFVYEKISSLMGGPTIISPKDAEYKLAQSGDATCNGLDSAEVGSRIMSLRKPPLAERCDFPAWFKGPRHWHALMGNAFYNYHSNDGSVQVIKPNGYMETRALCEQINKQTSTEMMAVVHYTTGCQSGFMCMMFYRRDTHVIEIQTGKQAVRLEDACAPDHFDVHKMPYITLLANSPDPQICPLEGLYHLRGAIGPPYLATRHKRNHSNKLHGLHGHHHHESRGTDGELNADGNGLQHKSRRGALSFRNSDRMEHSSWRANTRGLPVRSRRDALSTTTTSTTTTTTTASPPLERASEKPSKVKAEAATIETSTTAKEKILPANDTNVAFLLNDATAAAVGLRGERSRRDAPVCITNYQAARQLWVGCTEPNVIDVRPLCTEDGDEEYLCHGSWSENGTVYVIARHKGTNHAVCISYRPTEGSSAKLVIGDACYRGTQKPPEHHIVANLSVYGKCGETGNTASRIETLRSTGWLGTLAVAMLATILGYGTNIQEYYNNYVWTPSR